MLEDSGFTNITIGPGADTFGGTPGEEQARAFGVYGYTFLAFKERLTRAAPTGFSSMRRPAAGWPATGTGAGRPPRRRSGRAG
jgi:hypothetical protein